MNEQICLKGEFFFKNLSKEDLAKYPKIQYNGKIILLNNNDFKEADYLHIKSNHVLGVDFEAKPTFIKGQNSFINLIQIATAEEVYLIRIYRKRIPDEIIEIFENASIIKAGIGLSHDIQELKKIREFTPAGMVDLNKIAQSLGFEGIGVKKLSAILFGKTVSKRMQVSNWGAPRLSQEQIAYAATDAWIAREIYLKLNALVQIG